MGFRIQAYSRWPVWKRRSNGWDNGMNVTFHRSISKDDGLAEAYGWILSAVGHAALVAAAIMAYPVHEMREPSKPFRWNVQVVTSALSSDSAPGAATRPEQQPALHPATPPRHERIHPQRVPMRGTPQIETRSVSTTKIVETTAAQVTRSRPEVVRHGLEDVQTVELQRVEHPVPLERENHEEREPGAVLRKGRPIDREVASVSTVASTKPIVASSVREERTVETRTLGSLHSGITARAPEQSTVRLNEMEQASLDALPSDAPIDGERSTASLRTDRTDREQPIAEPVSGASDTVGSESPQEVVGEAVVAPGSSPAGSPSLGESTRPDYGWLAGAIRERIEEIKRYSEEARANDWEGRVVVAASIKADGHIVNIRVVESSGNGRLDADAKAIVGSASPLALSQPLGSSQVTVKVPIIFGLQQ